MACGNAAEHFGIEAAQEIDGLEIFPAAILVRDPAAGGAAVVEIQHGGDRIDAQAVDGVALQPEQRVRHQEIDDFGAAVIVDQRAPVEVAALHRIGVLVQRGAVEMAEAMRIVREMPGHPVQHARRALRGDRRRPARKNRQACRTGWSARTGRSADSPMSRRTGVR